MSDNQQPPKQDPTPTPSTSSGQEGLGAFWAELKRRKVMRVAITYAVVDFFPHLALSSFSKR